MTNLPHTPEVTKRKYDCEDIYPDASLVVNDLHIITKVILAQNQIRSPYANLPVAPINIWRNLTGTYGAFSNAFKAKKAGDRLFFAAQGIESAGYTLSSLSSTTNAALQIAGLGSVAVVGYLFDSLLPDIIFATTSLGFAAQMWTMGRSYSALKEFDRIREADGDEKALEYLFKSGKEGVALNVHKTNHFYDPKRYDHLKKYYESKSHTYATIAKVARDEMAENLAQQAAGMLVSAMWLTSSALSIAEVRDVTLISRGLTIAGCVADSVLIIRNRFFMDAIKEREELRVVVTLPQNEPPVEAAAS